MAFRLAALAPFAALAAAACSASDPPSQSTACGSLPQCPVNQACYNNVCTPIQNGSAGATSNPGGAGVGNPGTAGVTGNPGGGAGPTGSAGVTGNPAGGSTSSAGATGSTAGAGPTGSAGAAGGGTTSGGAGYWTSKDWHGCSWTGVGTAGVSTVTPKDFTTKAAADPYCVSGTVGKDAKSESVALLGFNVNEPSSASCVAKPADTTAAGPPSVVPTGNGIAVNFVKKGNDTSFTFRVQIQGPNGAMAGAAGAADRWCATIAEVSGKVFVPWSAFTPSCWAAAGSQGTPYAAPSTAPTKPISAVVFTVPGNSSADVPYNVCVNGLAAGSTAADAPDGSAVQGDLTGTIGMGSDMAADFQRVKVSAGGHDYIIQNNNWGNPGSTNQTLAYKNNSFKITSTTGTGGDAPASFPSIFIGNNGNTAMGVFSTKGNDNLPIQISAITSITSTFRYSPSITSQAINATYDIWFANSVPAGEYNDGIDGFVMIWLYNPSNKHPIGWGTKAGTETIAGLSWDVYKGPRGAGPAGNNNAPVISYVNPANDNSRAQSFKDVDILPFIKTATQKYGLSSTAYLTDVFAGFEIWDGGASSNLSVDEFKAVVNK